MQRKHIIAVKAGTVDLSNIQTLEESIIGQLSNIADVANYIDADNTIKVMIKDLGSEKF